MSQVDNDVVLSRANFISQGTGSPVLMIHGLAASLHDWDFLSPELVKAGFAAYALDLLGHGDSSKPESRIYKMEWLMNHFVAWLEELHLSEPAVLIGHSLGGYLALEYARLFPEQTRALVLVDPFYSQQQLPPWLRLIYQYPGVSGFIAHKTPEWLLRYVIDLSSLSIGHGAGCLYTLQAEVRQQTALDYMRTAPGVYGILKDKLDLTPGLPIIVSPTLVVWGERDHTLAPASFARLVKMLPHASGKSVRAGHVPHQSNATWFSRVVLDFIKAL